ncbi:MAG: response regulator transcription factor [Oscillospiraceae bacterium]|jgi:DNA-binding response OmpR family regulator|nr:response regulator transcription factor [Oscillospiraceae bacterium]
MPIRKVLIIDTDKNTSELLRIHLERENNETEIVYNPNRWQEQFTSFAPDIVVMDIIFQMADGWQICKDIRAYSNCPIIILSYKNDVFTKILGFELGADDYVVKPFDVKELMARIKAHVRRAVMYNIRNLNKSNVNFENLSIDMARYELVINSNKITLPPKEMELLFLLASNPNKVYTRNQLLDEVWGFEYYGDSRTVDVHIKRLREKLRGISQQWDLKTVWGVGYKFELIDSTTAEIP